MNRTEQESKQLAALEERVTRIENLLESLYTQFDALIAGQDRVAADLKRLTKTLQSAPSLLALTVEE